MTTGRMSASTLAGVGRWRPDRRESTMEIALMVTLVALAWKVVDTVKNVRAADWNAVITQLAVWGAGVAVVFLGSATHWAAKVVVQGITLSDLNSADKVLLGVCLLSAGSVAYDFKKAIDGSDSAKQHQLIPDPSPPPQ